jgi:predicted nucleic acid-binding protein
MSAFFADTFYWIALTNVKDRAHEKAKSFTLSIVPGALCTTEEVLTEYLNYFAAWGPNFRRKASLNVHAMHASATLQIVPQTSASFSAGFRLYPARLDKGYSLTDCISIETMRHHGIAEVLTNDAHFEQEGFHALFRQS